KIAGLGSEKSGVTGAHRWPKEHELSTFEPGRRRGGHSPGNSQNTTGATLTIDTDVIILNDCNFGTLHNLFSECEVDVRLSNLSFRYHSVIANDYDAATDSFALFPEFKLAYSKEHLLMIYEIIKFSKAALAYLENEISSGYNQITLGEFINL